MTLTKISGTLMKATVEMGILVRFQILVEMLTVFPHECGAHCGFVTCSLDCVMACSSISNLLMIFYHEKMSYFIKAFSASMLQFIHAMCHISGCAFVKQPLLPRINLTWHE